jgi:hypothetical protein
MNKGRKLILFFDLMEKTGGDEHRLQPIQDWTMSFRGCLPKWSGHGPNTVKSNGYFYLYNNKTE